MSKFKIFIIVSAFILSSLVFGIGTSIYLGSRIPDRTSSITVKSYEANQALIWATLLDIESYPLWKPNLKTIEMLGTNDKGYTKWKEHYSFGKSATYEIKNYMPKSLIELRIIESKNMPTGSWIYKLSSHEERGVLTTKFYSITDNYLDRFIKKFIDTDYTETDFFSLSLNEYLNQLLEDQEEVIELLMNQEELENIENTEAPFN